MPEFSFIVATVRVKAPITMKDEEAEAIVSHIEEALEAGFEATKNRVCEVDSRLTVEWSI